MNNLIFLLVVVISLINLARMVVYLLSSDAYTRSASNIKVNRKIPSYPTVSVVVPAHNEEKVIIRALQSLYESDYPPSKLEVIIANDGSTDNTAKIAQDYINKHTDKCKFILLNRPNAGKAGALNYAMKHAASGDLIMCLDSDSYLEKDSLKNASQHFIDEQVIALSSNVNIIEDGSLITLIQRYEYLVCYQMKKGQAHWGAEYIIGGIGSMFRRNVLSKVSYYDTNTMTEDIDLTLKILVNKQKNERIAYAADSITNTEAAHSISALMKQRYRWKYGRSQTYLKNKSFFFSKKTSYPKRLTWFMLPYSIVQDLFFLFEPLILGWILYLVIAFGDVRTIITAASVITIYLGFNIWSTSHLSLGKRLRLTLIAPFMYISMLVLTFVEYYALIKSILNLPKLKESMLKEHTTWVSPERKSASVR